jgi:ribonuclease HIII
MLANPIKKCGLPMSNLLIKSGNNLVIILALLLMLPMYTLLFFIKQLEVTKDRYSVKQRYLKRLRKEKSAAYHYQ